jgi:hypothetical protein
MGTGLAEGFGSISSDFSPIFCCRLNPESSKQALCRVSRKHKINLIMNKMKHYLCCHHSDYLPPPDVTYVGLYGQKIISDIAVMK